MKATATVDIEVADDHHCDNDCSFIEIDEVPGKPNEYVANCALFGEVLQWNRRRKYHGYRRCGQCKCAEVKSNEYIEMLGIPP